MNEEFPVSLDMFKLYFLREAGLEYQPYPTFVQTTYDEGVYVMYDEQLWRSTHGENSNVPGDETDAWQLVIGHYDAETVYEKGDIIRDLGDDGYEWWQALVDNPGTDVDNWQIIPDVPYEYTDWKAPIEYHKDEKVVAIVNFKVGVWKSKIGGNYAIPGTNSEMWELDVDETADLDDCILDADILRAMGEAYFKFNKNLFTVEKGKIIFLYLTMFFLVYDRQMAASGMNGNSAAGPVVHRTVGKMSVTYAESKLFSNYPSYEFLSTNDYGRKAFNLMMPYLRGGVTLLHGGATGE